MSDTNRVAVRFVTESVFGVTPVTPAFRDLRYTGAPTLAFVPETITSEEIRADRQVTDLILVGGETTGEINAELLARNKDELYESLFYSTWVARYSKQNTDQATPQITAVDADSYTVTTGAVLVLNDIVRAEGFVQSANNGFKIINTGTTATDLLILGAGLAVETPGSTARVHLVGKRGAVADLVAAITPARLTSTALNFTTLGLAVGDWVKIRGTGGTWPAVNNIFVRISVIAANSLTFDVAPGWIADNGAGATVDIYFGERLRNGVTRKSFTIEEEFTDHSPVTFQYLNGMIAGALTLTATAQEIVTEGWRFLGTAATIQDSGRFAGATTLAAQPTQVMNAATHVARLAVGGVAISGLNFASEFVVEIDNNLEQLFAVGSLNAVAISTGEFSVTGSLPTYFDNKANALLVIGNTQTSIDARFSDDAAHVHLWDLPRVKFSAGSPEVPGKNDQTEVPLEYRAYMHETLGYTAQLTRFHGVQ